MPLITKKKKSETQTEWNAGDLRRGRRGTVGQGAGENQGESRDLSATTLPKKIQKTGIFKNG